jgi:cytochrome P450
MGIKIMNPPFLIPESPQEIMTLLDTSEGKRFPHSLYHRLAELAPVYRDEKTGVWYLHRWADCSHVLRSPRFGGQDGRLQQDPRFPHSDALQLIAYNLAFKDPPEHTRLRRFAQQAFSRPVIDRMRSYLDSLIVEVLSDLSERKEFDIVSDYANRIPGAVICEMLGVPREDHELFDAWLADQFRLLSPTPATAAVLTEVDASTRELRAYVMDLIEQRRLSPKEDLISAFLSAKDEKGEGISSRELVAMTVVLLAGGTDTTKFSICMGTRSLIQQPETAELLRQNPDLETQAFEEVLRLYGPVMQANARQAYDDIEISGSLIKAGDWVVPVILSANLDPEKFPDPLKLDFSRNPNPHLAFGGGAHSCLGMMLARLVGPRSIAALQRHFKGLSLVSDVLDINTQLYSLRGLRTMRVRVGD